VSQAASGARRSSSTGTSAAGDDHGWLDSAATLATIEAKSARENFSVASRLLPRRARRHLLAIYAFARLVDDVGDEAPGNRGQLLDVVDDDIDRLVGDAVPRIAVLRALAPTVRECHLPLDPFHRLVEANRRDQTVHRYPDFATLREYCTLSANPVGHLVLGVFDVATADRLALSDDVCTSLQLVEHWQDVAEDAASGRIYLPQEDMARFGVAEADLRAEHAGSGLRRLLAFEVARAQALLTRGARLVGSLPGPARLAVAGFAGGGQAALDALAVADFDVLAGAPKAGPGAILAATGRLLLRRSA